MAPLAVLLATGVVWLAPAAISVGRIVGITVEQVGQPAVGTDFLNLYAGAYLFTHTPAQTYALDAQLAVQRGLTGWDSPIVPFYAPPWAALLLSGLAAVPYGLAYAAWLALGLVCLALATRWLAPAGRGWWLAGVTGSLLFLPVLLALKQGQTSLPALLGAAWLCRALLADSPGPGSRGGWGWGSVAALLAWSIKPQLLPAWLLGLAVARRWRPLLAAGLLLAGLAGAALLVLGPSGLTSYSALSAQKWHEAMFADGLLLPGPTLLQGSYVLLGVNDTARAIAAACEVVVGLGVVWAWRGGLVADERRLLQVALLPLAAVLLAPYALLHEASLWLAPFWLALRFSQGKPLFRGGLLLFGALFANVANLAVVAPDSAWPTGTSLLGLLAVALLAWRVRTAPVEGWGRQPLRSTADAERNGDVHAHADGDPALVYQH